MKATDISA